MVINKFSTLNIKYLKLKYHRQDSYCYRSTNENPDVWNNLERNWNHFFWLTGEIPISLQIISDKLQNRFIRTRASGRKSALSFRNQVSVEKLSDSHKDMLVVNTVFTGQ